MSNEVKLKIVSDDGVPVTCHAFPSHNSAKASILLLPGIGIEYSHYKDFACFLAENDFRVFVVEFRGVGHSFDKTLRVDQASLTTWAKVDAAAVFRYIEQKYGVPPIVFGHSFGGQVLCLADEYVHDLGAVIVASQSGHWRLWKAKDKLTVWFFWHIYLPFVSLFGRYTIKTPIFSANIPSGVAKEWAKWGRHPEYMRGYHKDTHQRIHSRRSAVKSYAFTDDIFAPPSAARELWSWFPTDKLKGTVISPGDLGVKHIGHFSAFKKRFKDTLWERWLTDLESLLADSLSRKS